MNHHHNTTNESGEMLDRLESKANIQQDNVLDLFRDFVTMSPSQVFATYPDESTPITSIRRAISNLTRDGYLIKTDKKVTGLYGRPEFQWKLNESGIVPLKKKAPQIANKQLKKDFEQLELQFAEVSIRCTDLSAQLIEVCEDREKLKQANDICHEQIEKLNKQLIGKDKEIDFLHGRINELNRKHNANK